MKIEQFILGQHAARSAEPHLFREYAAPLKRHLGITIQQREFLSLDQATDALASASGDVLMINPSWDMPVDDLVSAIAPVYEQTSRPGLLLVDWYDQTSSPHLELLRYVDVYARRQMLLDKSWYSVDFAGGYAHTHFLATRMGYDLKGWHSGSQIPSGFMHRLVHGWNVGADRRYERLLHASQACGRALRWRPIDINARVSLGGGDWGWYRRWRESALETIEGLAGTRRIRSRGRLSRKLYLLELMFSKITFSPFGWGEVCYRDFEALCCGSLLVKPSMAHLTTSPDVYQPFKTYVPVSWDLCDLKETCEYYLQYPAEAQQIAAAGRQAMAQYYASSGFVRDVQRILARIQLGTAVAPTPMNAAVSARPTPPA